MNEVIHNHFSWTKAKNTRSYIKPTLEKNPEKIIIHTGINNLKSDSYPEEVNWKTNNLTPSCRTQTNETILPNIVPQYDSLNEKVLKRLKGQCEERNIFVIDKRCIQKCNCDSSGFH